MAKGRSRSYRLRLSGEGTDLFLGCHCRLARLTRSFVAYGATLAVAMSLLERLDDDEIVAELMMPDLPRLSGAAEYFVGAPPALAKLVVSIQERLDQTASFAVLPPVNIIYVAALALMSSSEDMSIMQAHGDRQNRE